MSPYTDGYIFGLSITVSPKSSSPLTLTRARNHARTHTHSPFARLALAFAVVVSEEVVSIMAEDLLASLEVAQDPDAGGVPAGRDELAVGATIVVDVRPGTQPQLIE